MTNTQVKLELNSELTVLIEGKYYPGTPATIYPLEHSNPGEPSEFEIEEIKILKGNEYWLMDWANDEFEKIKSIILAKENSWIAGSLPNLFDILTLKCIEDIES